MSYVHMNDPDEPMIANMKKRIDRLLAECQELAAELAEEIEAGRKLKAGIQACVDDDFNSSALMIELTALVKPGM